MREEGEGRRRDREGNHKRDRNLERGKTTEETGDKEKNAQKTRVKK